MANKMVFINLPVTDIKRATSFYEALGFVKNEEFSNETSSGMVWSESIWIMLLEHEFYQQFLNGRRIGDTKNTSSALIAFSFDTPEEAKKSGSVCSSFKKLGFCANFLRAVFFDGILEFCKIDQSPLSKC